MNRNTEPHRENITVSVQWKPVEAVSSLATAKLQVVAEGEDNATNLSHWNNAQISGFVDVGATNGWPLKGDAETSDEAMQ